MFPNFFSNIIFYVIIFEILQISLLSYSAIKPTIAISSSKTNPIITWNVLASNITLNEKMPPPEISRVMALLDISMYNSLLIAQNEMPNNFSNPSVITGAAYTVLKDLFPNYINQISSYKNKIFDNLMKEDDKKKVIWGFDLGSIIGKEVMTHNNNTDSKILINETIPKGDCIWNGKEPVLPNAGSWKTFILKSGSEIQPKKPFECGSKEDLQDLKYVLELALKRSPQQIALIHFWGDIPPPIIWNSILNEYIKKYNMSNFDSSFAGVYLNVGIYDAFVSCWYTKYTYWTERPFQRITNLTTEIPTPNFPSYTSGHSVVSTTASKILGEVFPNEKDHFRKLAIDASMSRLWAGIHFKQDIVNGIDQGLQIGDKVVQDMHKPPHIFQ